MLLLLVAGDLCWSVFLEVVIDWVAHDVMEDADKCN